ncbi:hypothetical protein DPX16_12275 [Anabarilius grahami]|uniref:Uncharacterized protein n=1 Tax=Anabarilius grahami TaxID=495550 RepID=A0A3N0XFJ4_ANAGA|nr:hypothetical protein DPX16_12275 [Anabarilius grahami]
MAGRGGSAQELNNNFQQSSQEARGPDCGCSILQPSPPPQPWAPPSALACDENDLSTVKADKDCSPDVSGENGEEAAKRECRRKRECEEERQRECKKHLPEEFTANPRGVL